MHLIDFCSDIIACPNLNKVELLLNDYGLSTL